MAEQKATGRDVKTIGKQIKTAIKAEFDTTVVPHCATTAVNLSMVYAYYEIGRMIVEEEQRGEQRATYGTQLLKELSTYLTKNYGKGFLLQIKKMFGSFIKFIQRIRLAKQCLANLRIF